MQFKHAGIIGLVSWFSRAEILFFPIPGNNNREGGRVRAGTSIHRLPGGRSPIARGTVVGRNLFRHVGGECRKTIFFSSNVT